MVNESEPLINVVSEDKRKRLIGFHKKLKRLDQKGKGAGIGAPNSPIADGAPSAERRDLTHAGTCTERGKPVALPLGKRAVRRADGDTGKGGWRKRKPAYNRLDKDGVAPRTTTSSYAKASRLPSGLSSREI
jgi:hypothetical protein